MEDGSETLFDNLSRLAQRKSRAASVSPQFDTVIPIAISYSSGLSELATRSKAASIGDRWTKKTRLRTTEAEDLRAILFGQA
jgi:hypothetical protein